MFTLSGTINMPKGEERDFKVKRLLSIAEVQDHILITVETAPAATSFVFIVTRQLEQKG